MLILCAVSLSVVACSPRKPAEVGQTAAAAPAAPKVTVVYVDGTVTSGGAPVQIGQVLGPTVSIETGPASSCQIEFGEKNIMGVSQNAVVSFDFSKLTAEVVLKRGGLTSVLKGLPTVAGKDSLTVTTDVAAAGVRGTCFCMWCDANSTYICACNGTVHTIDAKGSNEQSLTASHHLAKLYSNKGGSLSIEAVGLLHHSDESVQALATKIGYTIDWTKPD